MFKKRYRRFSKIPSKRGARAREEYEKSIMGVILKYKANKLIVALLILTTIFTVGPTTKMAVATPEIRCLVISNRGADFVAADFEARMTGISFDSWTAYTTPDLSLLQNYDVVLLFEDGIFSNAPNVGNVIYEYVMKGGNLVIGTFYEQDRSDCARATPYGWGKLEDIDVFTSDTRGCKYARDSMDAATIVPHPIMYGVSTLWHTGYGGGNSPKPDTTVLAYWSSPNYLGAPDPAVGCKTVGGSRLVHIAIYPNYAYYGTYGVNFGGDFYTLWENAIRWARWAALGTQREIAGKLLYNWRPLKDFTLKTPQITWVYNGTNDLTKEVTFSYNSSTSNYVITVPRPGNYSIDLFVDAAEPFDGRQGFPGDFAGYIYAEIPQNQLIFPRDIYVLKYLHLTSPEDNSKVLKYFSYGKTYFGNITLAWDALPEATNYSISITQYNLETQPWNSKTFYDNMTSNTFFKPILPPNNKTTAYWLWLNAYNLTKGYGYMPVGRLGFVYDVTWSDGMWFKLGSRITGTVTDAQSGAAVAGATVNTDYYPYYYQNTTDAKGSYSLTLPIGNYNLTVSKKGYTTNTTQVTIKAGVIKTANIKLSYIPANITGYVLDKQTGKPLRDVAVTANATKYTTGADGKYSFSVREGTYNLTASKAGYYTYTRFTKVFFGDTIVLNITLSQTTATITGTVTDAGTAAVISGATVNIGSVQTTTGADGKYSLTVQPGNYQFTVSKTGYVTNTTSGTTVAGETKTVNVALVRLATLSGTITDKKTGTAISGVNVAVGSSSYVTGSNGTYSLSIAPGSYNLVVSKSGYVTNTTAVSLSAGTTRNINVALKSWGIISGVVTDSGTGAFIVGATVKADSVQNTTGADGKYTLIVEAGTYTVTITKQGYDTKSTSVTVGAGASQSANLAVTPSAGFPILLVVAGAGGAAAIVAVVLLMKRKPKPPPKPVEKVPKPTTLRIAADPTELLSDGKSTSTITIELLDEEGKPIKASENIEVRLSATLGKITSPVTIKTGESTGKATLTSSAEFGEGKVSAESKGLKGASTSLTFVERKRYCMHCGTRMMLDVNICPKCGRAPPSGVDVKVCPGCGEVIPSVARFCSNCGARQPETEEKS